MNISNFYIFAWCIFNVTFATRNMISRPLFVLIFTVTAYYTIYAYLKYKLPKYFHGLTIILSLFTIYGIILMMGDERHFIEYANNKYVGNEIYLISVYKSLLPIFPFYVFTCKGYLTEDSIRKWLLVFIAVTAITFYQTYEIMLASSLSGRTEFTNNQGNVFLSLVPFVLFVKNRRRQYILMAILMFFVLIAMKRGAILTGGFIVLWLLWRNAANARNNQRYTVLAGTFFLLLVGYLLTGYLYGTSDYFQDRVQSTLAGKSSERDVIYSDMINYYLYRATEFQQVFGSGANATLDVSFNYAHNDWLEILINQGFFGIIVYLIYWVFFFKQWKMMPKESVAYTVFGAIFIIYFFRTFFSMSYADMSSYATLGMGYCIAKTNPIRIRNGKHSLFSYTT